MDPMPVPSDPGEVVVVHSEGAPGEGARRDEGIIRTSDASSPARRNPGGREMARAKAVGDVVPLEDAGRPSVPPEEARGTSVGGSSGYRATGESGSAGESKQGSKDSSVGAKQVALPFASATNYVPPPQSSSSSSRSPLSGVQQATSPSQGLLGYSHGYETLAQRYQDVHDVDGPSSSSDENIASTWAHLGYRGRHSSPAKGKERARPLGLDFENEHVAAYEPLSVAARPVLRRNHQSEGSSDSQDRLWKQVEENKSVQQRKQRRRVGVLGISVYSGSDNEDDALESVLVSPGDDVALSPPAGSDETPSTRRMLDGERSEQGSQEEDGIFRSIVDELTVQNQALQERLSKYEQPHMPAMPDREKLFEIRFFQGLSQGQREQLNGYLTQFVRDYVPPAPAPPSVTFAATGDTEMQLSDMSIRDPETLAGPSFSGVEPATTTGFNTGLQMTHHSHTGRIKKAEKERHREERRRNHLDLAAERREEELGDVLVRTLEEFFRDNLRDQESRRQPHKSSTAAHESDETASSAEASPPQWHGWHFLNLVMNMAELHRFSVTSKFVRNAIRSKSTLLELSADDTKVRWIGASPSASFAPAAQAGSSERPSMSLSSQSRSSGAVSKLSAGSGEGSSSWTPAGGEQSQYTSGDQSSLLRNSMKYATTRGTTVASTDAGAKRDAAPPPTSLGNKDVLQHYLEYESIRARTSAKVEGLEEHQGPVERHQDDHGSGNITFFANTRFCSDLSGTVPPADLKTVPDMSPASSITSSNPEDGALRREIDLASTTSSSPRLPQFVFSAADASAPPSPTLPSSPGRALQFAGVTDAIPEDLFTLRVTTRHAPVPLHDNPRQMNKRARADPGKQDVKRRRLSRHRQTGHTVVGQQLIRHKPRTAQRHPRRPDTVSDSSDSGSSQYAPHRLTMLHPFPVADQAPTERPGDYNLSLRLPGYSWSPSVSDGGESTMAKSSSHTQESAIDLDADVLSSSA